MVSLNVLFLSLLVTSCHSLKRIDNICLTGRFNRAFLHLGESGILTGYNITFNGSEFFANGSFYEGCEMEIMTCPSCVVSLIFEYINMSCCFKMRVDLFSYYHYRCDHVSVTEPPYRASRVLFCGTPETSAFKFQKKSIRFRSKTKIVRISFFYSRTHSHAFTIKYKSEPNRQVFVGVHDLFSGKGVISSPYFPAEYPRDISIDYFLTYTLANTSLNANVNYKVHLIFTDFLLASSSIMEFYDGNRRIGVMSGSSFRPPVITTKSNSLIVRFSAKGQSHFGFKALFSFLLEDDKNRTAMTDTGCGGYVENSGGTIIMMDMVTGTSFKPYDCVWLIKPSDNLETYIYLKIIRFLNFEKSAQLHIRQGFTSDSPLLDLIQNPISQNFREHIAPIKSGYYVRLKAEFGPTSQLAISYSSFGYNRCLTFSDFLCKNYRCISKKLICDGYDHCGDESDESLIMCSTGSGLVAASNRWHSHMPNYYFSKIKSFFSTHMGLLLFLFGIILLTFIASGLTILIYRIGKARQERAFQIQMDSLSEIWDALSDEIFVEEIVIDEPPSYEPPPNYDDVIKLTEKTSDSTERF